MISRTMNNLVVTSYIGKHPNDIQEGVAIVRNVDEGQHGLVLKLAEATAVAAWIQEIVRDFETQATTKKSRALVHIPLQSIYILNWDELAEHEPECTDIHGILCQFNHISQSITENKVHFSSFPSMISEIGYSRIRTQQMDNITVILNGQIVTKKYVLDWQKEHEDDPPATQPTEPAPAPQPDPPSTPPGKKQNRKRT